MDFDTLVHELEQGAEIIKSLVTGISQAEAQIKPNAEDWSILEVVGHLIDEERDDFRMRVDLTLNHPGQQWPPIHPSAWVIERAYNQRDLQQSLNEFLAERAQSLAFLKSLQSPDWSAFHHSEYGDRTAGRSWPHGSPMTTCTCAS